MRQRKNICFYHWEFVSFGVLYHLISLNDVGIEEKERKATESQKTDGK